MTKPALMWLKSLPDGTTHISCIEPITSAGGIQSAKFYVFKYEDNDLLMYKTDNDNEYPQWVPAEKLFNVVPEIHSIIGVV